MGQVRGKSLAIAIMTVLVMASGVRRAEAANGAYAVDAADISDLGSCKVESWYSMATNSDFAAVANPSCVVQLGQPVELSSLTNYSRSGGDYSTTIAPKAKLNIAPTGIGKFGYSAEGSVTFDAVTGQNTAIMAMIPATWRFTENTRININAGWLWDRTVDQHYFTYGVGFDWKFTEVLQYTIEMYGQVGHAALASTVQPRMQTGVRYRPNDIFSVDLIYGRNITGEDSNWITIGTTIRFPPDGYVRKPDAHL